MVATRQLEANPHAAAEDLRKHVIRLLQANGEETKGNILVLPQVFLEFLDYDHKMALFLNNLLYWQSRTRNPARWVYKSYRDLYNELGFKESVIRRLLHGDPSTKTRKRSLTDLGVEVKVKRAPNGSPTCHYRINLEIFLEAIRQFLAEQQDTSDRPEAVESAGSNLRDQTDGKTESHAFVSAESIGTFDQMTTAKISSEENTSESSYASTRDDDLDIFFAYENRFGHCKERFHDALRKALENLGANKVEEVLERCATRGRSWNYVLSALAHEETVAPAIPSTVTGATFRDTGNEGETLAPLVQLQEVAPVLFISERVQCSWKEASEAAATVQAAWRAAYHQLEMQLDRGSFESWLRGTTLVDFEPETQTFLLVVRNAYARDMLQGRLDRMVKRILSDVFGQLAAVKFLLKEDWQAATAAVEVV